jgi:flagellar hook-associated protein 3 FlgL
LQNFRELVISAGNGGHNNADRQSIAFQLTGLRDQIVALSNLKDTNGQPLFSALGSAMTPFVGPQATDPTYTFEGLPGQSASQDVLIPFALDGDSAFMMHPTRDGAFNARITTGLPAHALTTSSVTVANPTTVATTGAAASTATGRPNSYPAYTVAFTAVDSTTVPGTTTATYSVTESPSVSGAIAPVTVSYPSKQSLSVTGAPGLSFTISGTPLVGDSVSINASASVFSVLDDAIRGHRRRHHQQRRQPGRDPGPAQH